MSEEAKREKKPKYPKTRWNYDAEQWETKASADGEWSKDKKKNKAAFIETADFIKKWKKAKSIADIGRSLCWTRSKVKGTRTRLNNSIQKQGWFVAFKGTDKEAELLLQDLPDFTDSQAAQASKQASEGFASNLDDVLLAFGLTDNKD